MGWSEDRDASAIHDPHAVREAHLAKAGNNFLQVGKMDEVVDQDKLDGPAHLPDDLSNCGLAHTEVVSDRVEASLKVAMWQV